MKHRVFLRTFVLAVFSLITQFMYSQTLSDIVENNAPSYKQLKINGETYAQCKPFHESRHYDTILIITTTPEQITKLVFDNFQKITNSYCYEYFQIFNQNIKYSSNEIDSILKRKGIKAIVKIGWNKDFYNSGTVFYSTFNTYLTSMAGWGINKSGTICEAYIDFFDLSSVQEPFVRVIAKAHSGSSFSFKEKSLANSIFGSTLKGLVKYNIVKRSK